MILGLFGLSGMATASVTIADGNDGINFAGEKLTNDVDWHCSEYPHLGDNQHRRSKCILHWKLNCRGDELIVV